MRVSYLAQFPTNKNFAEIGLNELINIEEKENIGNCFAWTTYTRSGVRWPVPA